MKYLPEGYVPDEEMRNLRTLVRRRAGLVRIRTSLKNRVHALLAMEGVRPPAVSDLFGKRGREGVFGDGQDPRVTTVGVG